jgi:hypothetical protein
MNEKHYKLLGLSPGCSAADAKHAYHLLAKKNHPDFFGEDQRHKQQLRMMRINEAYMSVMADLSLSAPMPNHAVPSPAEAKMTEQFFAQWEEKAKPGPPADSKEIGSLRDPAYAYYKTGFRYFREGTSELARKEAKVIRKYLSTDGSTDRYILLLALRALHYFERSYSYFLVVVEQYADSPWCFDARRKIARLESYSTIYQRICDNLARRAASSKRKAPLRESRNPPAEMAGRH